MPTEARFPVIADAHSHAPSAPPIIGLAIPCYRESARLPRFLPALLDALAARNLPVRVQVVDDGSGPREADLLEKVVASAAAAHPGRVLPLLRLPVNIGKGGTVHAGWDALQDSCAFLAFVDADGAVPAEETARLLAMTATLPADTAVFASRRHGSGVERTPLRDFISRGFSLLTRVLVRLPVRDSQCGMKVISASNYRSIRPRLHRRDFAFDIELTMALQDHGVRILEEPIRWKEQPGGHVRFRHVLTMGWAVLGFGWLRFRKGRQTG